MSDTITVGTIVGRYEKINATNPGRDLAGCVLYVVATAKGSLRVVTSAGPLGKWDHNYDLVRHARVGDHMRITLDTMGNGHRRIGDWAGDLIVGIATVDNDGNTVCDGNVPNRQLPRYFCD